MNFENYYNPLSSHQDKNNQINHLYLNITSKRLIMMKYHMLSLIKSLIEPFRLSLILLN